MSRSLLSGVVGVAAFAGLTWAGCGGGIDPGEYAVYRVAFSEPKISSSCFYDKELPPNIAKDSNTIRESGTYVLYAAANDQFYLDSGDMTLVGASTDDVYAFDGKAVDVEYSGNGTDGAKVTYTDTTHIDLTVDGDVVTGTRTDKHTVKCAGTDNECSPFEAPSCSRTINFVGTQVDNVDIKDEI